MASPLSVLKNVLNLNKNFIHVDNFEVTSAAVNRYGESFEQKSVLVHARPYKRVQRQCPICRKRCSGYDTKQATESCCRAPNLNGVPVYILYQPRMIECPEHGVLTEYIPWADGTSRFTSDFNGEITWMVCRMSMSSMKSVTESGKLKRIGGTCGYWKVRRKKNGVRLTAGAFDAKDTERYQTI